MATLNLKYLNSINEDNFEIIFNSIIDEIMSGTVNFFTFNEINEFYSIIKRFKNNDEEYKTYMYNKISIISINKIYKECLRGRYHDNDLINHFNENIDNLHKYFKENIKNIDFNSKMDFFENYEYRNYDGSSNDIEIITNEKHFELIFKYIMAKLTSYDHLSFFLYKEINNILSIANDYENNCFDKNILKNAVSNILVSKIDKEKLIVLNDKLISNNNKSYDYQALSEYFVKNIRTSDITLSSSDFQYYLKELDDKDNYFCTKCYDRDSNNSRCHYCNPRCYY